MRDRLDSLLDDIAGHEMLEDIPRPALAGGAILAVLLVLFAAIAGVNSVGSALTNSDELEPLPTGPPPSMPEAARVVDDIETLADFGYRKIDTVAHSNAGELLDARRINLAVIANRVAAEPEVAGISFFLAASFFSS